MPSRVAKGVKRDHGLTSCPSQQLRQDISRPNLPPPRQRTSGRITNPMRVGQSFGNGYATIMVEVSRG